MKEFNVDMVELLCGVAFVFSVGFYSAGVVC